MTNAERCRLWREKNPKKVKRDNKARKKRRDCRQHNRWKRIQHWVWTRCHSPKSQSYRGYGDRGIKCLISWIEIARVWFRDQAWMMKMPQLDRIDPDGHYEFSNVRFLERSDNLARRRTRIEREPGEEG